MPRWSGYRRGEAAIAAALLALGLYVVWASSEMPAGSISLPGPGFFPTALGVLLVISALGIMAGAGGGDGASQPVIWARREFAVTMAALVLAAVAFQPLGAIPTLALFLAMMIRTLARVPWWRAVLAGVIGAGAGRIVFVDLLDVRLPAGLMGF